MSSKDCRRRLMCVLLFGLLLPSSAMAGPYFGEWSCFWRPSPDCPRGLYSPCHYWLPEYYELRSCCRPVNIDQYPPGPTPPVAPSYLVNKWCCPTAPAAPTAPYADPSGYYGRPMVRQPQ
jgi:hypothetical protein